jgi:hypothetical protein
MTVGIPYIARVFDSNQLGPETTLLFVDPTHSPDAGVGAWRTATEGGEFAFITGRPFRWNHAALHDNTDFILREFFDEGGAAAVLGPRLVAGYQLRLGVCAPHPISPPTGIPFELPSAGTASVKIYDVAGRLVRSLVDGSMEAGPQSVIWNGRNEQGQSVGSGVYYLRLEARSGREERSVILVR